MSEVFTVIVLFCAAATATACAIAKLIIENGKSHSPFSVHTAVFALFAVIAVQYAGAKHDGTNDPPARIMNSWVSNRGTLGDVNAWMKANADNNAWNACAIVKGQKYVYFEKFFYKKFKRVKEVPKGDW